MKILNIDAFAEIKRQISFGGILYDLQETSVQDYINNLSAAEKLEATPASDREKAAAAFNEAVESILVAVPTMPREVVVKLKLPAMTAVLQFIRGEFEPVAEAQVTDTEKKPS